MQVSFTKMHGLGNDFVIIDTRMTPLHLPLDKIRWIADRRRGIGCDQVIIIADGPFMRILNADGSEVENCGNALRCVGLLLRQDYGSRFFIDTPAGRREIDATDPARISVSMGKAKLVAASLPFHLDMFKNPDHINMGNPHLAFFVDQLNDHPLDIYGEKIEHHPDFPGRINVETAQVISADHINMRVWERGVGLTQACGSGACAVAFAAYKRGLVGNKVFITMPGGELEVSISTDDEIIMTGPAELSFVGQIEVN